MVEYLKVKEVATIARVSRQTVDVWIKEKGLPAVRIGGSWRISKQELELWIKKEKGD
ncbi:MAG: helix-turn-helix domain-containing protein [Candidatus Omnitrophota bacterium]